MKWGKAHPTIPSRFLYEITGQADNPNYVAAVRGQRLKKRKKPPSGPHKTSTTTTGGASRKRKTNRPWK